MVGLACPREMCVPLLPLSSKPRLTLNTEVAPNSDYLDSEDEVQIGRKRKVSKAALEKQKMAAKKKAKKRKDNDDGYEDDDDEYTALSKSLWTGKSNNKKPSIGSLEKCAECSKQFTVVRFLIFFSASILLITIVKTKYTIAADPPPGYLCHPCAKASGTDPFKKPPAPRKRKSAVEKRNILNHQERKLPTLVSLCIKVCVVVSVFAPFLTYRFCDSRSYPNILTMWRHLGTSGLSISTRLFVSSVEIDPCKNLQLLIVLALDENMQDARKCHPLL